MTGREEASVSLSVWFDGLNGSSVISICVDGEHVVSFRAKSSDRQEAIKEALSFGLVHDAIVSVLAGKLGASS